MNTGGHTIFITGGASGIGLAFATRLLQDGNTVIVCGRRGSALEQARTQLPGLQVHAADLSLPEERVRVAGWVTAQFPKLDVLFNNAGIQQYIKLAESPEWPTIHNELAINLEAHIHLTTLLIPHLAKQPHPAILITTSGLAFVPLAAAPIYCATKAAMRSFTLSLRHQLAKTPIEVVEVIPPAVKTDLGGPGLHDWATPLDEFVDAAYAQLRAGKHELTYGFSQESSEATKEQRDAIFARMNRA